MTTIDKQALAWVVRRASSPLNDADAAAFEAWYEADIRHQGAFLRASAIQTALERAAQQRNAPRPLERPLAEEQHAVALPARRTFLRYGAALAACALVAAALFVPAKPQATVLTAAKGQLLVVPLGDRTLASINSGSRIEVVLSSDARAVALRQGEVFFEVAKDPKRPFVVSAGALRVRALGTAFGVRLLAQGAQILVTEGSVEVWSADRTGQPRRVTAGQGVLVSKPSDPIVVQGMQGEARRMLAWRSGKLVFADQKLSDAVAEFNRYSVRQIVIGDPSLKDQRIVGQYPIESADTFARDVGAYLKVPVVIAADRILIGSAAQKPLRAPRN